MITKPARRPRTLDKEVTEVQFERVMGNAARGATVLVGIAVLLFMIKTGQVILAPVFLSIIIGLMFGPVADWVEHRGIPPALSALVVVALFLGVIAVGIYMFSAPIAGWIARGPAIWENARNELMNWREPFEALTAISEQVRSVFGDGTANMTVAVEGSSPVTDLAFLAPGLLAQIGIFLASLYFFIATRRDIRHSVLSLCISRSLRWRSAHIFRDVEGKVSHYLLTITAINICVGIAVAVAMWLLGMPTPLLWGALAGLLNFIPFIGQAVMMLLLLAVGLGTRSGIEQILLPVGVYWGISLVETQMITPHLLGRTLTLNPFMIFLALTFWIWAWGPVGGLVAVPSLLILHSIVTHVLPSRLTRALTRRSAAREAAEARQAAASAKEASGGTASAQPPKPRRRPSAAALAKKPA